MLRIGDAVQLTDTGRQREANEDSLFLGPPLFAVADGMGGAQAGEVASHLAVEAFAAADPDGAAPEELLRTTIKDANRRIFDLAQGDASRSGMGTTLTAALLRGEEISFGHVGDSRAYVFRDGELKQITNDHSLVEELRRQGRLSREQAADHPQRSVITRALGPEPDVEVDTMTFRGRDGDVFLLCSDGLTTMLSDEDVHAILRREGSLEKKARWLVRAANERGGRDNITVVLFSLTASEAEPGATGSAAPDEGVTLIGASAEDAGLTAGAVQAAASEDAAARRAAAAPPPRRRPRQAPVAVSATAGRRTSWPKRILKAVAALAVIALLAWGAVTAMKQVWFLGVNDQGEVAIYRGLPYELPFGIDLYSEQGSTGTEFSSLPEDRRGVATDHEWRSEDDARSLADDLSTAAAGTTTGTTPTTGTTGTTGGDSSGTGGSQSNSDDAVPGGNGGSTGGGNAGQNSPPGSSG